MKRVFLFLLTNIAILAVLSVALHLLGVESMLAAEGVDLDLRSLLIMAAVMGFGGSFISLALSKFMAKRLMGAQVITSPQGEAEHWLVDTVAKLSTAAGIGMPEVAIFDSPTPNAFATGMRRDKSLVAVSSGLLRGMSRREVEAVLAHEVSHVANGDMITLTLIQGVVNTFVFFLARIIGHLVDRAVFRTERGHGPAFFITTILAQMVLGILASIVVFWFSRRREFRADAGAAGLVGAPAMTSALQRLLAMTSAPLPEQMAAFGISGGRRPPRGFARLFLTHPPLEERIAALQNPS
ncbi:MAG: protease HtpX [Planctomycetota bacterium]